MMKPRRPLCLLGLLYVAVVFTAISCTARGTPTYEDMDREQVVIAGYVDGKECRITQSGQTLVISLSDAIVLKENQIAILEQFLSDSEKIPQYKLHSFWKENRERLRREDTRGIEGALCYMEEGTAPKMGSLVIIRGDFRTFMHATNPGEFDAADYYRIMGQQGRILQGRLLAESRTCAAFQEKMYQVREYFSLLLDACYDVEDASVMKAMLLGEKGTLDAGIKELYQQNGIIHILAVSGLHLSVLGMGCHKILKKIRCPNVANILFTVGLMYCYGTMTGMGVSMVRAYIMFALHLFAVPVGRTYDLLTAVTVAAFAVLLRQPFYLFHSGFLFSFGAVCGIGIFLPAVSENLFGTDRLQKALFSGIAVSISTLPVYLCFYYEFPPYSVLLNLIVIPCMTFVLLGGAIGLMTASCFLPFGRIMACPVHLVLAFYEKCCDFCLNLPGNQWITGCPRPWQTAVFLGILVSLVIWNHRLSKLHFWQGVLCALFVLTVRMPDGLQITMIDVGQGDSIYLTDDNGVHMLIDGGSSNQSDVASYQMLPFLKYEGVSYLDAIVVTHPDSDHISGIRTMLEETRTGGVAIGTLYLPDVGERGRTEEYHELEQLAQNAGVTLRYIGAGDQLRCGEMILNCIHPEKGWDTAEVNAYSVVLHLTYGNFTALFTGDLEGEGERRVLEALQPHNGGSSEWGQGQGQDGITLLKVAHHGSKNSTSEAFLQAVNPKIALISAGRNNRYGHPHEELLKRLEDCGCLVYRTQEGGAVTVHVRGRKMSVETFLR